MSPNLVSNISSVLVYTTEQDAKLNSSLLTRAEKLLHRKDPLLPEEIISLYEEFVKEGFSIENYSDKFHVATQVYRLYSTVMGLKKGLKEERPTGKSSNGALLLTGKVGEVAQTTFVYKKTALLEGKTFSVPDNGGAKREQLAYLLDKNHFAKTPPAFYVDFTSLGLFVGSLSYFEEGTISYEEATEIFDEEALEFKKVNVDETSVRKSVIHAIQLFHLDPGANNFLVPKETEDLRQNIRQCTLIDFGYTLPEDLFVYARKLPFERDILASPFTSEECMHIRRIDSEETAALLISHGISEKAVNIHKIAVKLLKAAVEKGGTLNDVVNRIYSNKSTQEGKPYKGSFSAEAFELVRYYINPIMLSIVHAKTSAEQDALINDGFQALAIARDDAKKMTRGKLKTS